MVQIPVHVLWGLFTAPAVTVIAIMVFMNRFVTKKELELQMEELTRNRVEVWAKIDEIKDDTTKIKIDIAKIATKKS